MKSINYLIGLTLLTAELLLIYGMYFIFYPFKPVTFNRDKFDVLTKEVQQGGSLIYHADICKNMEIATEITRSFNNGFIYLLPTSISTVPKGCQQANVLIPVPEELPAGKYFLRTRFTYKINALRTITIVHDTDEFEVIPTGN